MNPWLLAYDGFDPPAEQLREALCTLGNGYFATRGAAPEVAADAVHYPGTYVAGVYVHQLVAGGGLDQDVNRPLDGAEDHAAGEQSPAATGVTTSTRRQPLEDRGRHRPGEVELEAAQGVGLERADLCRSTSRP